MGDEREHQVYFIAGFSPRKGVLGAVAYLHELESKDVELSRFYMVLEREWMHEEIRHDIISVGYTRKDDAWSWLLLDKRGRLVVMTAEDLWEEEIPDAGTGESRFGYLSDMVVIDDKVYSCGLGRQIYVRRGRDWARADEGIRVDDTSYGLRSIHGLTDRSLHAVGYKGEIWYFDGRRWNQATSPTNATLEVVRETEEGVCYACGKNGVVLRGYRGAWEVVGGDRKETFWGLSSLKGRVYLASTKGLYTVDDDVVAPLSLDRRVEGRRLYSNGEELWSLEHHEIWVHDGGSWNEVECPDNATVR